MEYWIRLGSYSRPWTCSQARYRLHYTGLRTRGRVVQSVKCLAADTYLTADSGVASSIILSWRLIMIYFLWPFSSLPLIREMLLSFTSEICARSTGYLLSQCCSGKGVVRLTDHPQMTIIVDWDVKNQIKPTAVYVIGASNGTWALNEGGTTAFLVNPQQTAITEDSINCYWFL